MTFAVTSKMRNKAEQNQKTPVIILSIEDVDTKYGSSVIVKIIKIGDPGLLIGSGWKIGGLSELEDQEDIVSFEQGTTTQIDQSIDQAKGTATAIANMRVALIDKDDLATQLMSPGEVVTDLLGRRCKVYFGFKDTAFPEDYITIFRGLVNDIESGAGIVTISLASPDEKKRQDIFIHRENNLNGSIDDVVTTLTLDSSTGFFDSITGPGGSEDPNFKTYVRIDDEIIEYTGVSSNDLTGLVRGSLGTTAAAHDDDATVSSFYRISGNIIDIALKLMLSGWNGPYITDLPVTNFEQVSPTETEDNAIFFEGVDLEADYNVSVGDFITTTGASNGANNVTLKEILSIDTNDFGSYIVVDGVTFVNEPNTSAVCDFRSQYDTLPDGLKMYPDEVDIAEHLRLYRLFLSSFSYDFYLSDTINGKEFIEQEVYKPAGAYWLPRKSQASIGYNIGPIPGSDPKTISAENTINPNQIKIKRTTTKNFYNTVIVRYDESALEPGKFLSNFVLLDNDSRTQIENQGNKVLEIKSKGLRSSLTGGALALQMANRRLDRYKFAAEFIPQINVFYGEFFNSEVGDVVVFDGSALKVSDIQNSSRDFSPRLMEITNKKFNLKKNVIFEITDTGFSATARYCLVGPSSNIKAGVSQTQFVIEETGNSPYGADEYRKWSRYPDVQVKVRSVDSATVATAVITAISGNLITVSPALGFTPSAGYIMELSDYDGQTEQVKLLYGHMSDGAPFADGGIEYQML